MDFTIENPCPDNNDYIFTWFSPLLFYYQLQAAIPVVEVEKIRKVRITMSLVYPIIYEKTEPRKTIP
jgi:hypothetical protein